MVLNPPMGSSYDIIIITTFQLVGNHDIGLDGKADGRSLAFFGTYPNVSAVSFNDRFAQIKS